MDRVMKPASFLDVVKTIAFGALGVRRRADHERETTRIKPLHIIVAGIVAAALFILTLITIVRMVVGS
ncbi:MAG: DUF2970 domain-containing protein [Betaproteobacteria bacterium]|jgi:hypothetical protein|nr:DUF2970 domain-containing protein [Betaproteobacteria bacterium]